MKRLAIRTFLALSLLLVASLVQAHPPGLSSVELQLTEPQWQAKITFAVQDIEAFAPMDSDLDAEVSAAEREAAKPAIAQLLANELQLAVDGSSLQPVAERSIRYDEQNNAEVLLRYPASSGQRLNVQSNLLNLLPEGHQQFVSLRNAAGVAVLEKMLTRADAGLQFDLANVGQASADRGATFGEFFKLGVEHIVTGYDHLLFLFALLAVTHSFWPALKIITFFTIAHSITLALASLNLIELPASFVEPFIAATIIYVAVENILRGDHPKGRQWLTFGFGLIHGFGFASVLQEMNIASGDSGILLPLLSFNLGLESGQIAIASVVLPVIWQLNNRVKIADLFLRGCSALVALVGLYWLIERTLLA